MPDEAPILEPGFLTNDNLFLLDSLARLNAHIRDLGEFGMKLSMFLGARLNIGPWTEDNKEELRKLISLLKDEGMTTPLQTIKELLEEVLEGDY